MTTRYQMKEMPDLQGTGEPITYPKMVMTGQTGTRELAEYIAMTSGFSKGVTPTKNANSPKKAARSEMHGAST